MRRYRLPIVLIPIAAFLAIHPLIVHGCSCGHDFDFHIISWFEAARQLAQGALHPHWAYTPAWNAGEPRFIFYPPLSWTLGALLGLLLPWTWTPVVYTGLALAAAGFALYYSARSFVSPNAALVAAAIYIANPYTLYTAFERTAYAELLAAAWIPLLLRAILREQVTIPGIAIPVALLWLTNAPAAVMGCYALALIALVRLALSLRANSTLPRLRFALNTTVGTLLGLCLAAFYIIPAAYERRFVQIDMAVLPGMDIASNFLFHHTADPDHDHVLRIASIVSLLVLALTAIALAAARIADKRKTPSHHEDRTTHLLLPLAILATVIALMLTPLSAPLWNHFPQLGFLQFPWRLVAILAAVFALSVAIALAHFPLKSANAVSIAVIATLLFTIPAYRAFNQRCYPEDTLPERLAIFHSTNPGTDPTDEYTPITADNDALAQTNPGYWLATASNALAPKDTAPAPAPQHIDLTLTTPQILILNLRDYPAWRITRNGSVIATHLHRSDGLIAFHLPAGASHIDVAWMTLPDQSIGYTVSALAAILLLVLSLRSRKHFITTPISQPATPHR